MKKLIIKAIVNGLMLASVVGMFGMLFAEIIYKLIK